MQSFAGDTLGLLEGLLIENLDDMFADQVSFQRFKCEEERLIIDCGDHVTDYGCKAEDMIVPLQVSRMRGPSQLREKVVKGLLRVVEKQHQLMVRLDLFLSPIGTPLLWLPIYESFFNWEVNTDSIIKGLTEWPSQYVKISGISG